MDWDTYNLQLPLGHWSLLLITWPQTIFLIWVLFSYFLKRRYNNFHKVHILCVQFNEFLKRVYPSNHHPDQHISGTVGASFGSPSWTYPANLSPRISFATFLNFRFLLFSHKHAYTLTGCSHWKRPASMNAIFGFCCSSLMRTRGFFCPGRSQGPPETSESIARMNEWKL